MRSRPLLHWLALIVALVPGCQSKDATTPSPDEAEGSFSLVGRWRYSSESVDLDCNGPELERDQDPRRTVEFVGDDDDLRLQYETCKIPLVTKSMGATSDTSVDCPWVDGMSVTVTSTRAELRTKDFLHLVTETHIRGKHPQAEDQVFDCEIKSDGMLARVKTGP